MSLQKNQVSPKEVSGAGNKGPKKNVKIHSNQIIEWQKHIFLSVASFNVNELNLLI